MEQLEFKVSKEWEKYKRENPWISFVMESARDSDGNEYERKKGSSVIYKKIDDGYLCINCNSEIMAAEVIHPVWDGPFALSGSGKTAKEMVPYCPKCEEKPKSGGSPINC